MFASLKVWQEGLLRRPGGQAAILLVLVLLIYGRGLTYEAINWDDPHYGPQGVMVRDGFTPENLTRAWGPSQPQTPTWHPLTWWSLALDRSLYGNWAGGFRLTALLIHFVNAVLVLRLAGRWGLSPVAALFSACLFACHPLQVESVIWISERKGILAGTGALAAVLWWTVYIQTRSTRAYWISLTCFVLSLLCKQMALALPGILLGLELWPLQRNAAGSLTARMIRWVREYAPFALVSLAFAAVAVLGQAQSEAIRPVSERSIWSRMETATVVTARLARRVVWPNVCACLTRSRSRLFPHLQYWPQQRCSSSG